MIEASDLIGNPISLLFERVFWLCLGFFLCSALVKSYLNSQRSNKKAESSMADKLQNLAQKAIESND